MLIINAKIITMSDDLAGDGIIENGFIKIENGKISDIGSMEDAPLPSLDDEIIDLSGRTTLPGFIDAHTHLGLCRAGEPYSNSDINPSSDIMPQNFPLDAVVIDSYFDEAAKSGVTAAAISFGSASPMPGKISVIKTHGRDISSMTVKEYAAQKMALGENLSDTLGNTNIADDIRRELKLASEYISGKSSNYDKIKADALKPLLNREIPAHIHVHTKADIITALRIADEFNIKAVLIHATEGYMVADAIKERGVPVIYGPIINDKSKMELINMDEACPAVLSKAGIFTALCTDHPETPAKYLQLCAAVAVRNGMDKMEALRAITINAAKILGISDRTGSLKKGKDADLVIFSGNPIDVTQKPEMIICGGETIKP